MKEEVDLLKVGHPSQKDENILVENNTIKFCMKIYETLKLLPEASAREIMRKVSKHPKLKKGISVDRAWAGLRLIKNRPDVVEYQNATEEQRKELNKPVLKEDGNVNYEFYIEMYKHRLDEGVRAALEDQAKREGWSYRRLIKEIRAVKDKVALTTEDEKVMKSLLIREIIGLLRRMSLQFIREVKQEIIQKINFNNEIEDAQGENTADNV
jgi:hypothetical protein